MRIYEIYDEDNALSVGTLLYYEKERSWIIELREELDEWTAPLLFTSFIKRQQYTIPREISALWVKGRIIPSGRQNIDAILRTHRLKEYNEMTFLEISEGRCSQDGLFIRRLDAVPDYVRKRTGKNLTECSIAEGNQLLCIFADGKIKKVDLARLYEAEDVEKLLLNPLLFESAKVSTGGYAVCFNDSMEIPAGVLYEKGRTIPLTMKDLLLFLQKNVLDTSECCELLECSRQNLAYLVKEEYLTPVRENVKGNLYLKGDVVRNKW